MPDATTATIERMAATVVHVADDPHTRYRSCYLLDQLFLRLVELAGPVVFVEAGAFEADTSLAVAEVLPGCRVVAFEANPHNVEHFTGLRDYAAAGVDYRFQALAAEPGTVTFNVIASSSEREVGKVEGMNSLLRRTGEDYLGDVDYEEVSVEATTLDAAFADEVSARAGCFAMWVDVEGAAGVVLAGAHDFLDRCDVLKIEVEDVVAWHGQWLDREVIEELARHGLVPVARDAQGVDQYNLVFLREGLARDPRVAPLLAEHEETSQRTLTKAQSGLRRNPRVRAIGRRLLGR